jgi:hypothetical protein
VAVGEHVEVGVGDASIVEVANGIGESAIAHAALVHERSKRLPEWLRALG